MYLNPYRFHLRILPVPAIISQQTGFKIKVLAFKLCPIIFTTFSKLVLLSIDV